MANKKSDIIQNFDPNGVGIENGNFIGLPFSFEQSEIVIYPVPWDVTVSYTAGTSRGPQNLLNASYQLDLYLEDQPHLWKKGIFFIPVSLSLQKQNDEIRILSSKHIQSLESQKISTEENKTINKINTACEILHQKVEQDCTGLLQKGKKIALVGGEHSVPLGYIKALSQTHDNFGILQFDAHCDLREAYEGFQYSHASIFYNVLQEVSAVKQLTQIGIRDFCEAEYQMIQADDRIRLFTDQSIRNALFEGKTFQEICNKIIGDLPDKIYISFDIDCLQASLCPNTGTPVPGGFSFNEIVYICQMIQKSGKEVIGFDLSEIGGKGEWDGNVAARIMYRLMSLL